MKEIYRMDNFSYYINRECFMVINSKLCNMAKYHKND